MQGALAVVNTHLYGRGVTDRLTKADWIEQGLKTLEAEGPNGLKVGPMATALKVSRGSFYWHFSDIADFRAQLLEGWRGRTTDKVIRRIEGEAGAERLRTLLRRAFEAPPAIDRAIRAWAAGDPKVAETVGAVDGQRIAYIAGLLGAAGVEGRQAQARATFLYWAHLGQPLALDSGVDLTGASLDEICALFES